MILRFISMRLVTERTLPLLMMAITARAEDVHWITGPGNNTEIEARYGTATQPLQWSDTTKWFSDVANPQTPNGAIPVDGQSIAFTNSCCNPEPFVDIDNGGAGVDLSRSAIRFDAKTNIFDSSAGDPGDVAGGSYDFSLVDDVLTADTIAFNGAGGRGNDVYVSVVANTLTSNRHGAVLNAPITVNTILARSGHQDKWQINASPTGPLALIELDENRGPDGGTIDGSFAVNADLMTDTLNHIWSRLVVGSGAKLTIGTYNVSDYSGNPAPNNNNPPLELNGEMIVETFTFGGVEQADGTWGAAGSGADHEVSWITGEGQLTVGSGNSLGLLITEVAINNTRETITLIWDSKPGREYSIFHSTDLLQFDFDIADVMSQGDSTSRSFPNPDAAAKRLFFRVIENE